jgi:hypothetical protein
MPACPCPHRYAPGDPIEAWLHELLCLDAGNRVPRPPAKLPHPGDCQLYYVERDTLFSYHKASEMFLQVGAAEGLAGQGRITLLLKLCCSALWLRPCWATTCTHTSGQGLNACALGFLPHPLCITHLGGCTSHSALHAQAMPCCCAPSLPMPPADTLPPPTPAPPPQGMVSLYVASHYKNTPNDLILMSDAPAHHLFVLLAPVDESQVSTACSMRAIPATSLSRAPLATQLLQPHQKCSRYLQQV